jgi:hypothetical protein
LSGGHFGDEPEPQRLCGVERLPGQQEIAAAVHAQEERVDDVHPVSRHDVRHEMRGILELCGLGREHDVAQQRDLGVAPRRAVDRADHRDLDVQEVHQEMPALPVNAIDPLDRRARREGRRPGSRARPRELVPRPGQDDDPILAVGPDVVERLR